MKPKWILLCVPVLLGLILTPYLSIGPNELRVWRYTETVWETSQVNLQSGAWVGQASTGVSYIDFNLNHKPLDSQQLERIRNKARELPFTLPPILSFYESRPADGVYLLMNLDGVTRYYYYPPQYSLKLSKDLSPLLSNEGP